MKVGPSISSETLFTYRQTDRQTDIQTDILYKQYLTSGDLKRHVLQKSPHLKTIKPEKESDS